MDKETKKEFEDILDKRFDKLALIIKRGFDDTVRKVDFDEFRKDTGQRFENIDQRFSALEQKVDDSFKELREFKEETRQNFEELKRETFTETEKEDLLGRVSYVETKLGIESGK